MWYINYKHLGQNGTIKDTLTLNNAITHGLLGNQNGGSTTFMKYSGMAETS
jgi:hypothetical protein